MAYKLTNHSKEIKERLKKEGNYEVLPPEESYEINQNQAECFLKAERKSKLVQALGRRISAKIPLDA